MKPNTFFYCFILFGFLIAHDNPTSLGKIQNGSSIFYICIAKINGTDGHVIGTIEKYNIGGKDTYTGFWGEFNSHESLKKIFDILDGHTEEKR
jgi:hypothetical protein